LYYISALEQVGAILGRYTHTLSCPGPDMISKLLVEYIFLHHEKDGSGSSLYLLNKD
jgi:hypothetical protein